MFIMGQYCGLQTLGKPDFPSSRWALRVMAAAKELKELLQPLGCLETGAVAKVHDNVSLCMTLSQTFML